MAIYLETEPRDFTETSGSVGIVERQWPLVQMAFTHLVEDSGSVEEAVEFMRAIVVPDPTKRHPSIRSLHEYQRAIFEFPEEDLRKRSLLAIVNNAIACSENLAIKCSLTPPHETITSQEQLRNDNKESFLESFLKGLCYADMTAATLGVFGEEESPFVELKEYIDSEEQKARLSRHTMKIRR